MPLVIGGLVFGSAACLGWALYERMHERVSDYLAQRVSQTQVELGDMFMDLSDERLKTLYLVAPLALGVLGWLLTWGWIGAAIGAGVGVFLPRLWLKHLQKSRVNKFHVQLVDALLLITSCLRAGLSMLQSFTVVAEEMPKPVRDEFGLLLKEVRMGVGFEEALIHFKKRMPSDDTSLFVTAVLVTRETGGEVTAVFTRLVETLRERKKIKEKIDSLTFMSRMQGIVMMILPIVFLVMTTTINPGHFSFFMQHPMGRILFVGVIIIQIFSAILFMIFSKSPIK